jgi:hypothetical protein
VTVSPDSNSVQPPPPSTPTGGTPTPTSSEPQPAAVTSASPRGSKGLLLGVCAVVAVVVVVLAVLLSGALSPTSSGDTGVTFRPAWSAGNQTATAASSANWNLTLAAGYDSPMSVSFGISNITQSCSITPVGNSPVQTAISIPAFSGSLKSGDSPYWLLAYEQNSTGNVLLVSVSNGAARPIGVVSGACVGMGLLDIAVPGDVMDSSAAASLAAAAGGSAYVAAHPGTFLTMGLVGGIQGSSVGPLWSFQYSPCGPFGGQSFTGNASALIIEMSALNGSIFVALNATATCFGAESPVPLSSVFAFGMAQLTKPSTSTPGECNADDYCYEIAIAEASQGLTANDLELELTSNTGNFVTTMDFYIDGATPADGYLTAPAGENPALMWFSGAGTLTPSTPLNSSDTIWIDVSPTVNPVGQGDLLTAIGMGSFSGQLQMTLP